MIYIRKIFFIVLCCLPLITLAKMETGLNEVLVDKTTGLVFQTIVKNTGLQKTGEPISISLKTWRISPTNPVRKHNRVQGIKLKEDWAEEWLAIQDKKKQVKQSARIAFKWATFPSKQTFEPGGDYNWGMISFGLPPGTTFDLLIVWQSGRQSHERWIKNIQCPEDK